MFRVRRAAAMPIPLVNDTSQPPAVCSAGRCRQVLQTDATPTEAACIAADAQRTLHRQRERRVCGRLSRQQTTCSGAGPATWMNKWSGGSVVTSCGAYGN